MSQQQKILQYLKKHRSGMTRMDAFNLGVVELSARIIELEAKGNKIAHHVEKKNNKRFTRYVLVEAA